MQGVDRSEVTLVPYHREWAKMFLTEKELLKSIIGKHVIDIQHFGSTAIGGIATKPVIDILVGVEDLADVERFDRKALATETYYQLGQVAQEGKIVFAKFPSLPDLRRTHYMHVVEHDGTWWKSHIGFRDALIANPSLAKEYEALKKELAKKYPQNVRAYSEEKAKWIQSIAL